MGGLVTPLILTLECEVERIEAIQSTHLTGRYISVEEKILRPGGGMHLH
jgi:hypothetical protein